MTDGVALAGWQTVRINSLFRGLNFLLDFFSSPYMLLAHSFGTPPAE
jgi:hypothetical protein